MKCVITYCCNAEGGGRGRIARLLNLTVEDFPLRVRYQHALPHSPACSTRFNAADLVVINGFIAALNRGNSFIRTNDSRPITRVFIGHDEDINHNYIRSDLYLHRVSLCIFPRFASLACAASDAFPPFASFLLSARTCGRYPAVGLGLRAFFPGISLSGIDHPRARSGYGVYALRRDSITPQARYMYIKEPANARWNTARVERFLGKHSRERVRALRARARNGRVHICGEAEREDSARDTIETHSRDVGGGGGKRNTGRALPSEEGATPNDSI